jgi:hypothetical protein
MLVDLSFAPAPGMSSGIQIMLKMSVIVLHTLGPPILISSAGHPSCPAALHPFSFAMAVATSSSLMAD